MLVAARSVVARVARRAPAQARSIVFTPKFGPVEIPSITAAELVIRRAAEFGDRPALVDGTTGRTIKYSELSTRIGAAAQNLIDRGFQRGDVREAVLSSSIGRVCLVDS